jgi:SAM-dependent methyltransferase
MSPDGASTAAYVHTDYERYRHGARRSAETVARLLVDRLAPGSVLDVGCGAGDWLDAFRSLGVTALHGMDGPWSPAPTRLGADHFTAVDFESADLVVQQLPQDRYDLVISMEFLEHVNADRADALVGFLTSKSDAVLVSTAIPLQGGQHHVNERWPEYWTDLFRHRGFVPFDVLRLALWNEPQVEAWYRQNIMLYFRGRIPPAIEAWGSQLALAALTEPMARVHPEFYARRLGRLEFALHHPARFARMLLRERQSGIRETPPVADFRR